MLSQISVRCAAVVVLGAMAGTAAAGPGRIVVANDEWTLSNTGFTQASPSAGTFATNVASWFTGGGAGTFLAYSNNFGLNQSSLASAMTGAGHSWTVSTAGTFTAAHLLANYDAVYVGGFAADNTVLIDYVNGGGNVYIMGGTGLFGGAAGEAAAWNTFLSAFGMSFASQYNNVTGNMPTNSTHPIFSGVTALYQNNGSSIINVTGPHAQLLVSSGGNGLYAVYDVGVVIPLPAPAAMATAGLGLLAIRRKRCSA